MAYNLNPITSDNEQLFRAEILDQLRGKHFGTIVDLGAWDGFATEPIVKLVGARTVICVDNSAKALAGARKRGYLSVRADLNQKLTLSSSCADLVIVNNVIEHITKTDVLVSEAVRIVKKGGLCLFCTPNLASWHNIGALTLGFQPFSSQVSDRYFLGNPLHPQYGQQIHEDQAHLRLFTKRSLVELCAKYGLVAQLVKGVGFYPFNGVIAKIFATIDPVHSAYLLYIGRKN